MTEDAKWDLEVDVVVLGSGGAAMTAAIAAHDFGAKDVVILEKTGMVGGTTAMSGGMLWIPNNHYQREAGIDESDDDIVTYLDSLAPDALDPETLGAFMESGPEMVRYFADKTPVRFHVFKDFPDCQPYMPGADREQGGAGRRARLSQQSRLDDLRRQQRDPALHHREDGAGALMPR